MNPSLLQAYLDAPVSVNVFPRHDVDALCALIDVMADEGFRLLEILARPVEDALLLLRELNDRPQRANVRLAVGTLKRAAETRRFAELQPDMLVSPAFSRNILDVAAEFDLPYLPGVCTLQDIQDVIDAFDEVGRDVRILKLCPVEIMTWNYVRMISCIHPEITFCPTGTITLGDLSMWRSLPCIGPAMEDHFVPSEMIDTGDEIRIRRRLQEIRRMAIRDNP
ncbi:MAG: bifunctional 4-hydroxy-2-oxoglutarate aldolase/2-dehydro-3-deoxy-phosphogluconate aldolase [Phycisphaerae bacterium]|nr:bifunctional 4-hydroxy-2-oxoglutarate aldolase/2-dehydro-3-deoxy-phosphogluconate aldolase [Phycisphaerae bacterium]